MKKKGLIVRIIVLITVLIIIGIEVYLFVKPRKSDISTDSNKEYVVNKDNLKYIVDTSTSYFKNGLSYKLEKSDNKYYVLIDGLKDKTLEKKINTEIKRRVDENSKDNKLMIYNRIEASFSNVLSITIGNCAYKGNYSDEDIINGNIYGSFVDSYNVSLTNGEILNMEDLLYNVNNISEQLTKQSYDLAIRDAGFFCDGGPCENPYPDYSNVEDFSFKVLSKFKKNDYKFYFDTRYIYLIFDDLDSKAPISIDSDDINKDNCSLFTKDSKNGCVYIEECYDGIDNNNNCSKLYIDLDNKRDNAVLKIDMVDLIDNIIIYDKYVSDNNLYNNDQEKIDRKFINVNMDSNFIREDNKTLIDYDADIYEEKVEPVVKNLVLDEMLELQTDDYNIYSVNGSFNTLGKYNYVYYNVYHYSLNEDKYLKNKRNIYINKFYKREDVIAGPSTYKGEYDFLKEYNDKNRLYFYIIDSSTGEEFNSIDIINKDYDLETFIPNEWLSLGKYKSKDDLINNLFITMDSTYISKDRLIMDISYDTIVLKYQGKEVYLCKNDYNKCDELKKEIFGE